MTIGEFKNAVAEREHLQPEQIRFWVFCTRQNSTYRVERPLAEDMDEKTMASLVLESQVKNGAVRLYVERAHHQTQDSDGRVVYFPHYDAQSCMLFVRFYDPKRARFEYLGGVLVKRTLKGADLVPIVAELKKLPPNTPLKVFEEIKPGMIEPLKMKNTLAQSELMTGDILSFQLEMTKEYHLYTCIWVCDSCVCV